MVEAFFERQDAVVRLLWAEQWAPTVLVNIIVEYYVMSLAMLTGILVGAGYSSKNCGQYRTEDTIYNAVLENDNYLTSCQCSVCDDFWPKIGYTLVVQLHARTHRWCSQCAGSLFDFISVGESREYARGTRNAVCGDGYMCYVRITLQR